MPSSHLPFIRRSRRLAAALLLLLATVVLAACGGSGDDNSQAAAPSDGPATLAPPNATVYGEILVRPSGDVEAGIVTAARRMLRVDDPGRELRRLFDEQTDGQRGVFTREIDPWLGSTIGGFLLIENAAQTESPDGAVIADVRDRDAAQAAIDRLLADRDLQRGGTYEGVDYSVDSRDDSWTGLIDDFFVVGTAEGFRAAVVASRGRSLADEDRFTTAADELADDRLAWAYVEPAGIARLISDQAEQQAQQLDPEFRRAFEQQQDQIDRALGSEPITASLTARADQVVFDVSSGSAELPQNEGDGAVAIGDLPGDAWAAFATPLLGDLISRTLRQAGQYDEAARAVRQLTALDLDSDVLGWLGGIAAFVRGTSPLDIGGGIVIGSGDPAASQRFVGRLERIVGGLGLPTTPTTGAGRGFQLKLPTFPQPIVVLAQDDKVVLGLGVASTRDALDPDEKLDDTEPGKSAIASLGDDFKPAFVLVPEPMITLLRALGLDSDPDFQSALPYLTAYRSIVAGSKQDDGRTTGRLTLNLQDPEGTPGDDGDGEGTQTADVTP
ncbi:DUF3352 domain-containing protein [Conexibacter sp. CPCC 206217]|uniref:DUF3352 domain-containing protein n=1 Tax=Conexibacter sp. CPCC 206217 TaxID=3064574 RepID=UPI00271A5DF8|nr:DUF3352 domain-containing protein [Conexibacter sp. CPCC 206217]MDO8209253.1 DUF3352 domain-containing protein [Conexibacter sp. CPCC 206217]